MSMNIRGSAKAIVLTLAAQILWVIGVAVSTSILVFLFGTTSLDRILRKQLSVPAWTILLAAILVLIFSVVLGLITRKASVVRGRQDATRANLALLREFPSSLSSISSFRPECERNSRTCYPISAYRVRMRR